jgi:hypothetical protein
MAFLPSMPDADMKDTLAREPAIGILFSQLNEAVMRGDAPGECSRIEKTRERGNRTLILHKHPYDR